MRTTLLFCAIAASTTLAGFSHADPAASSASATATQPTTQPAPQTSPVKRGGLKVIVDGQGAFDPVDSFEVRLRFKVYQGELSIASIARNGAAVKKGDVLLEIDPTPMKRMLAAVENDALAARATLERAQAEAKISDKADVLAMRQQQEGLKEAEQGVTWFETVDGPQFLKQAELAVQQAKDQMNDEQDELDQLRKMYKSEELTNATADIVVKRAVRQLDLSKTGYNMIKERADKVRSFNYPGVKEKVQESLESARQQFALFEASQKQAKVLRGTSLATIVASTDAANRRLDELKEDAAKLTVRAPFDGVVCYGQIVNGNWSSVDPRTLRPEEHVTPQAVLMTLYQPGRLRVAMDLPESKFFAIGSGQKASISPTAFPEMKYDGMCDPGPKIAGANGSYLVTISPGEVDHKLVPGMKAQVHMEVPLVDDVLLVPASAVTNGTVWAKTADGSESRHVMTGRSDGKMIEILSGVREGDEVLTQGKP